MLGKAVFGIDHRVPGMLYAAVKQSPQLGGTVASFEAEAVLKRQGVVKVISLGDTLAVLADNYWAAKSALDVLPVTWKPSVNPAPDQDRIVESLRGGLSKPGYIAISEGDITSAKAATGARIVTADYETPFLEHAKLEPSNATAHVRQDLIEVWSPTQSVGGVTLAVAIALGVPPQRVRAHQTFAGGNFGRGGRFDLELQAVRLSKEANLPVKVIWSREEDIRHDFYRPASINRLSATISRDKKLVAWEHKAAMQALTSWFLSEILATGISAESLAARVPPSVRGRLNFQGADPQTLYGMVDQAYRFPAQSISHSVVDLPIPIHPWRSVGHSNSSFAVECFMDESAAAAGVDPMTFRRQLLSHSPRHLTLLDKLASAAKWGTKLPKGKGQGIAYHECYGGVGACAIDVEVTKLGELKILRVVMVADAGIAVNPNLVRQQMEGGAVFGLSAALNGRITIKNGGVEQSSFADNMPMLLGGCPAMETHIIDSGAAIGGVGELATPLVAPALVNAIFASTGKRIRRLPLSEANLSWS